MADDPRLDTAAEWLRNDVNIALTAESAEWEQGVDMLHDLDLLDPLRALLADEDRAVDKIGRIIHADWAGDYAHFESSVYHKRYKSAARAVLAALQKVADHA